VQPSEVRAQFEYLIDTRARFLPTFEQLGWKEFQRDREASWGSMLGIFLHILDVEEGWWQIATRGGATSETPDRKTGDYSSFEQVKEDNERVGSLTRTRVANLTEADLNRTVDFRWPEPVSRPFD
jgi:uncharacterized damage-inducible protein DinB